MIAKAGAYWLIDEIAFQQFHPRVKKEEFQAWLLKVNLEELTAVLHCEDGNGRVLYSKPIPYTDFPLAEIKIYVSDNVIILPSENRRWKWLLPAAFLFTSIIYHQRVIITIPSQKIGHRT